MPLRGKSRLVFAAFIAAWAVYFGVFYWNALSFDAEGNLIVAHIGIWGDWAAHFSMGSAMAYRKLFLLKSPLLLDAPFRYPFAINFLSAVLVRLGVPFNQAFTFPSFVSCVLCAGAVYYFFRTLLKTDRAALTASAVFFFNGGLGFLKILENAVSAVPAWRELVFPRIRATHIDAMNIYWYSIIDSMMIPQRAFPLGIAVALMTLVFVLKYIEKNGFAEPKSTVLIGIGILWGILPLIHMHSFFAVSVILLFWFVSDMLGSNKEELKVKILSWTALVSIAALLAVPACFAFHLIGNETADGMRWNPGWYAHSFDQWLKFWIMNWGITPLIGCLGARLWLRSVDGRRRFLFLAPFVLFFVLLNTVVLQPWIWDNSKLLAWVSVGVAAMAGLWASRQKTWVAASVLFLMTFSGALDAYRLLIPSLNTIQMYSAEDMNLAEWARENTEPDSLWLTSPHHNNWVLNLTGRRVLMAFEGWLWTHGYRYGATKELLNRLFKSPHDVDLYRNSGIDYIVVGPVERRKWGIKPQDFDPQFKLVKRSENYSIYSTERRRTPTPGPEPVSRPDAPTKA